MQSITAHNASLPVGSAYEDTISGSEILSAHPAKFHPPSTAHMTFSLIPTKNGTYRMPNVNDPTLLKPYIKIDVRIDLVEFVDENEDVISAYVADETDIPSSLVIWAPSSGDQRRVRDSLPPNQRAAVPTPPNDDEYSNIGQTNFTGYEEPLKSAVLLDPGLDEPDGMQQMPSTHRERKRREKSPELKFTTFQKSANFDTFRPLPRSHFSSDAVSVWPLRSIEESRLLMHFIQNLAPWVRL